MSDINFILLDIYAFVLQPIMGLLLAVAILVFLYGIFELIRDAESDTARIQGRKHILYGLIGMVIMISVYGIIFIITNTIELPDDDNPQETFFDLTDGAHF